MSARPPLTPDDAERLLAGGPDPARERLGGLLARAAAPGRPEELAGMAAATAAFRREAAGRAARRGRTLRRALLLKVAAVTAAVTAVGGVAFAAHTGVLPSPFRQPPPAPAVSTPAAPSTGASPTATAAAPSPSVSPHLTKLHGLCRSFLGDPAKQAKATANPSYAELVAAAGGRDLVEFCTALVGAAKPSPSPARPNGEPSKGPDRPRPSPSPPTPHKTK